MLLFTLATLTPAALLVLGVVLGGGWSWAGAASMTLVCATLDRLIRLPRHQPADTEFPTGDILSVTLALLHLPLLGLAVWAISGWTQHSLTDRTGLLIGFALFFGQIGHPNAHELIHRPARLHRVLGTMVYATLLFGHHVSAHRLVHHTHVGTERDPNSAPKGMGFWRFAARAWIGSFKAGWRAERDLSDRSGRRTHPYFTYVFWSVVGISSSYTLAGIAGISTLLILAAYVHLQILLADYVQHYGLRRAIGTTGKPEPVRAHHSWNSPHPWSSAMMLNAPRHSDHHQHPMRPYPALRLEDDMPVLPYSLPVMAVIALWPPLWRRLMDARVAAVE